MAYETTSKTQGQDQVVTQRNTTNVNISEAICQAGSILAFLVTVFILLSMLVYYGKGTRKWKNTKGGKIFLTCFAAIALSLPKYAFQIILMYADFEKINSGFNYCGFLVATTVGGNYIAILSVYLFLWLRQKAIYSHPIFQASIKWKAYAITFSTLLLVFVSSLAIMCAFTDPNNYHFQQNPCDSDRNRTKAAVWWLENRWYVLLLAAGSSHFLLLFLLLYPILRNRMERRHSQNEIVYDRISATVRRNFVCTAIALASSLLIMILLKTTLLDKSLLHTQTLMHVDVLINNMCILGTFKQFGNILTAICGSSRRRIVEKPSKKHQSQSKTITSNYEENFGKTTRKSSTVVLFSVKPLEQSSQCPSSS